MQENHVFTDFNLFIKNKYLLYALHDDFREQSQIIATIAKTRRS